MASREERRLLITPFLAAAASSSRTSRSHQSQDCMPQPYTRNPGMQQNRTYLLEGEDFAVKIHEYQAKDILARYGIPVQPGKVASTPEEAEAIARELGGPVVVKAQVYVGGRGKAGGVKFGKTPAEAREVA